MILRKFAFMVITLVMIASADRAGNAQEQRRILNQPQPSGLALQINTQATPLIYTAVPGVNSAASWSWYARFKRLAGWRHPEGSRPVSAIKFSYSIEGDGVRINVSALLGEFHEKEKQIANYLAAVDQKIVVHELESVGVVPFEVTVVRAKSMATTLPTVTSNAKSVEVLGIEINDSNLPRYEISLRNASNKAILTIELRSMKKVGSFVRRDVGPNGLLAHPGAIFKTIATVGNQGELTAEGYTPEQPRSIVITSVLFDDWSYEGDAEPAASTLATLLSRRLQIDRVLELLKNAMSAVEANDASAVKLLRAQVGALPFEVDESMFARLLPHFQSLNEQSLRNVRSSFRFGLGNVKTQLLDEIRQFERADKKEPAQSLKDWLSQTVDRYRTLSANL